jgi:hypothetical protein
MPLRQARIPVPTSTRDGRYSVDARPRVGFSTI